MCRGNTAESVEGVPLPQLRKGRNKRIDWCHRAHLAMFRHLAKHKPDRRSCGQGHLEDLLTDLNCVHPNSAYSAVVYPRVQRALEAKFVKLVKEQIIVEDLDGTCVWPTWTASWTRSDWDGDTEPPLLPVGREQTSILNQAASSVDLLHLPMSTLSLNPTYMPPSPPETSITPRGQHSGHLQSSGVLTTGFDPSYVPTNLSPPGAQSSGWSTTSFDPSYAPTNLSTPGAQSSGWSTTSFNPSYAPSHTSSRRQPRSGSSGMSTTTFDPSYAPSRAITESILSRQDDGSSRLSTTSFNPSYAPSSTQHSQAQTPTPPTVNMLPSPPATPRHSRGRRSDEENFLPGPQNHDDDPIFPSDSSSNLGARCGRRRQGAQHPLPTVREQEVEHEDLAKGASVSPARQHRRSRTQHTLDNTQQRTPSSLTPLSTAPLCIGQHVNAWLNQQQDPPRELPELPHLAVMPLITKTPSPSKPVAVIPNHDTDVRASLATSFPILVRAINDEKLIKLNAANHSRVHTLSAIDDAISAVTSLLHGVQRGGGAHARLDPAAAVTCKDALAQCRSVLRGTEKRSGDKDYENARAALQQIHWLRRDLAGLASTAGVANPWHGKKACDDEAGMLVDLVFGRWARY
ncbi:hypothetical protein CcaCcLH18_12286 [Colletotrichum camelliae]|nr:hypothetical protein CcaCcLH18_12286 [Colletotrichum camelliae]